MNPGSQIVTGARGAIQIPMPRFVECAPGPSTRLIVQGADSRLGGAGGVTVPADEADADVRTIIGSCVSSNDSPPSTLVNLSRSIHQKVVSDVGPPVAVHVEVLNGSNG